MLRRRFGINGGEDRRSFTCASGPLSADHAFSLRCDGVFVWGSLQAAKIYYSGSSITVPLMRGRVAGS